MITVRAAKYKELDTIVNFQVKMARETEGLELDQKQLKKGVEAVFEDFNKGAYYVAEDSDRIVACLLTTPEWSEWRNGTVLWIQSVYVIEDYRGQGVFRTMYEHIKAMVEHDDDMKGIRLYVEKNNLSAQKVYKAIGMNGDHYQFFEWMKTF
ncbi:Acetyltransferase, GNAT family [Fulvivirga imtechensis AK7]|uniref:Acetyltransferase, GNAT family n=1 Tax=Fulvivirga imtechensis AK7 TaxID=1237149 RepID=L8K029_9BACT|nr:GNAT family N-acetyltransferase [Fulvivirga imtechensis]ELR72822.1 Acetyltransferase, GNAT family [Fulvivirga imtechensis AK7]